MGVAARFVLLIPPAKEGVPGPSPGGLKATGPTAEVNVGDTASVATTPLVRLKSGAATITGAKAAELTAPLFVEPYSANT